MEFGVIVVLFFVTNLFPKMMNCCISFKATYLSITLHHLTFLTVQCTLAAFARCDNTILGATLGNSKTHNMRGRLFILQV